MMMALGWFVFELRTLPFQNLSRSKQVRWGKNERFGARPGYQFLGPGEETITLDGELRPELTGGSLDLGVLRTMADSGSAWILLGGNGRYYGEWIIDSVEEKQSEFFRDGTPRKLSFSLTLKKIDAFELGLLGDLLALW